MVPVVLKKYDCRLACGALIFKMAAIARDSSRFAGIKTVSEKFSQPEVDAEGRVRKVCDQFLKLKDLKGFL